MKNFTGRAINSTLNLQKVGRHIFCLSLPSSPVAQKNKMCIQKFTISHLSQYITFYIQMEISNTRKVLKGIFLEHDTLGGVKPTNKGAYREI